MKVLEKSIKFAHLGKPGSVFSKGFERRLRILENLVDFKNKKILDLGCGEGVWLSRFTEFTNPENVYGSEFDAEQVENLKKNPPGSEKGFIPSENIVNCPGENLAFPDNFFDIVFLNEVLEHVADDQKTLDECLRVLKKEGKVILFTPNRAWPFEQHGMFFREKYYWGNIPLLPWLPWSIYKKLAPHVRNYSNKDLKKVVKLAQNSTHKFKITYHSHIFPGFDGAVSRFGFIGKIIQKFFHFLEKTPLQHFGISHLVIAEKR